MDKEKAIKIFRNKIECLSHSKCSDCPLDKVCDQLRAPSDSEYIAAYGMAIEALSTSEIPNKWIPVKERLPQNSGNYLITYCYRDEIETQEAVYVKDEKEDKWFDITDIEITLAVIAWMPLPEPYKAESEVSE